MAGVARPGVPDVRDGRIPCPLCGGLLHPVAGKCKHCKTDLAAYRSVRPAANAPLPALNQAAPVAFDGPHVHPPVAHAMPVPPAAVGAALPVLPPRPPVRNASQPAPSAWRSWPIFVIVIATMAIVAAVVLMMWPSHGQPGKRALKPPPAPERMDTQTPPIAPKQVAPKIDAPATPPPPPQGSADPWGMRAPAPQAPRAALDDRSDPSNPTGANAPHASTDPADPDLDALDPFATAHGSPGRRHRLSLNPTGSMVLAMQAHLCRKLAECGHLDVWNRRACSSVPSGPDTRLTGCPAAQRCLGQIDATSCTVQFDPAQMGRLLTLTDCLDAMHC